MVIEDGIQMYGAARLNPEIVARMGEQYSTAYQRQADAIRARIDADPDNTDALLGLAETNVLLFIFGYSSREETISEAQTVVERAAALNPETAEVHRLSGILSFLDWDWQSAEDSLLKATRMDPQNLAARHWYSLYLTAMGRFDGAMAESDALMRMDPDQDYLVGRGSILYFQHRFAELKDLMLKTIAKDPTVPWGYDWLGMAYNGLGEHDDAIKTYLRAFELSDGTAEVGAGLGHAAGQAGEAALARQIAGYYAQIAPDQYVPPVQRAYVHIGLDELDEAIALLEQAYEEYSWFLIFMKVEPWLDPLRDDERFSRILGRMGFPDG